MSLSTAALTALFLQCAPQVAPETLHTIVRVESSANPLAIAVVGVDSVSSPKTESDAISIIKDLEKKGFNYSVGLMQVNKKNFLSNGLTLDTAFNSCKNIAAGAKIFTTCYVKALKTNNYKNEQKALRAAMSCYYSGNFSRGYQVEKKTSYVDRVNLAVNSIYLVPKILPDNSKEVKKEIENELKDKSTPKIDSINNESITEKKKTERQPWDVYGDYLM